MKGPVQGLGRGRVGGDRPGTELLRGADAASTTNMADKMTDF